MNQAFAFETARLSVRLLDASDEAFCVGLYTNAQTMHYIGPAMSTEAALAAYRRALRFSRQVPARHLFLMLVEKSSRRRIGMGTVQAIDSTRGVAEAGIIIASTDGARGYASEGLSALIEHAFQQLPLERIWLSTHRDHAVVTRMLMRIGLQPSPEPNPFSHASKGNRVWIAARGSWSKHEQRMMSEVDLRRVT